jgi:hypothetical protein
MHVPHRFLDQYEEQELWTPFAFPLNQHYPGAPARAISTFTAYCSLAVIMVSSQRHAILGSRQGRIITRVYGEGAKLSHLHEHLRRLSSSLKQWRQTLPPDVEFDPTSQEMLVPPPHVLSLQYAIIGNSRHKLTTAWCTTHWSSCSTGLLSKPETTPRTPV